jgi:glycolate oxidase FAD binding subunit
MTGDRAEGEYRLYGLEPEGVLSPTSPAELAELLRQASADRCTVVPWGAGTRQHIGGPPARYDRSLSMLALDRIIDYSPADLVVTAEAGVTLGALQAELARHGQWLPWDPPLPERATIGGLLASGASGPLRLGYGPPRDWTLGMSVALTDGRLVKSGGRVVKNVAGYDTHKLHIGALGTLGVIATATFKVAPLPEHRQTLLAAFTNPHLPAQAVEQLRASPLQPIALVALNQRAALAAPPLHAFLDGQPAHILVAARFAGTEGAVRRQIREAARRCVEVGARTVELREEDDGPLWSAVAHTLAPAADGSLLLRAGAPSDKLATMAALLERAARRNGWQPAQLGISGVGLLFSRWATAGADRAAMAAAVAELRTELAGLGGYAVIEEAPAALAGAIDHWGPAPPGLDLMRALRTSWDPAGILNPGRYLV